MRWILIVLSLFLAGAGWAVKTWGWPAIAVLLLLGVLAVWAIKRAFRRIILLPFKAKGAVLRDAQVKVNAFRVLGKAPPDEDETGSEPGFLIELDLTVNPKTESGAGPFQLWEPHSLQLYPAGSRFNPQSDESEDSLGDLKSFQVWHEGHWVPAEGDRLAGAQRLLCQYRLTRPARAAALRYYLEDLGELRFI